MVKIVGTVESRWFWSFFSGNEKCTGKRILFREFGSAKQRYRCSTGADLGAFYLISILCKLEARGIILIVVEVGFVAVACGDGL